MADSKETTVKAKRYECPRCGGLRFHKNEFGAFNDKGKYVVDEVVLRCLFCHEMIHEDEIAEREVL